MLVPLTFQCVSAEVHTSLRMDGQREQGTLAARSVSQDPPPSRLFFVLDSHSDRKFLVDTGAEVSVLPASPSDRRSSPLLHLHAVNGTSISVYGRRFVTVNLGQRRNFRWIFLVAAVNHAILGADFLSHFALLVVMSHKKHLHTTTGLFVKGHPSSFSPLAFTLREGSGLLS